MIKLPFHINKSSLRKDEKLTVMSFVIPIEAKKSNTW